MLPWYGQSPQRGLGLSLGEREMRRVMVWIVGIAAVIGAVSICVSFNADMGRVREIREERRATPTPTPSWTERCFFANGESFHASRAIKTLLKAPDTYEHRETTFNPTPETDGSHALLVKFTAKNAFGVPLQSSAIGFLDPATCRASGFTVLE